MFVTPSLGCFLLLLFRSIKDNRRVSRFEQIISVIKFSEFIKLSHCKLQLTVSALHYLFLSRFSLCARVEGVECVRGGRTAEIGEL